MNSLFLSLRSEAVGLFNIFISVVWSSKLTLLYYFMAGPGVMVNLITVEETNIVTISGMVT